MNDLKSLASLGVNVGDVVLCYNAAHDGTECVITPNWREWGGAPFAWWKLKERDTLSTITSKLVAKFKVAFKSEGTFADKTSAATSAFLEALREVATIELDKRINVVFEKHSKNFDEIAEADKAVIKEGFPATLYLSEDGKRAGTTKFAGRKVLIQVVGDQSFDRYVYVKESIRSSGIKTFYTVKGPDENTVLYGVEQ
jgi:hypothetical protein